MLIKVCGLRHADNVRAVARLGVDWVGFIFYAPSPRCLSGPVPDTPQGVARVGVFVGEEVEQLVEVVKDNKLSHIQLHGNETPDMCGALRQRGYTVIKAISVAEAADFAQAAPYHGQVDFLLFDTKTSTHGGSGQRFDWSILAHYQGETPFWLSGGIAPEDAPAIRKIDHPKLMGVDLNSRFEIEPGLKNAQTLELFIKQLNR